MTEPKFKLGDRVKVFQLLDSMTARELIGLVGTIQEVDPLANGCFNYYVRSARLSHYMHEEELEMEQ